MKKNVFINGEFLLWRNIFKEYDKMLFFFFEVEFNEIIFYNVDIEILFEDEYVLIVNKLINLDIYFLLE